MLLKVPDSPGKGDIGSLFRQRWIRSYGLASTIDLVTVHADRTVLATHTNLQPKAWVMMGETEDPSENAGKLLGLLFFSCTAIDKLLELVNAAGEPTNP